MYDSVKDSGEREDFDTGSVRDSREGKGRYDLISPLAMHRFARHYENGAKKYDDRNWEKGMSMSRCMDSLIRHAFNYLEGMRDEDHLAAIMWNAAAIIHYEEMIKRGLLTEDINDLPDFICREQN